MNPIYKAKDRVALPSGKTGTVQRVHKSGFLAIITDDARELVLHPKYCAKIHDPIAPTPRDLEGVKAELAAIKCAIRSSTDTLLPYREQLAAIVNKMAVIKNERRTLVKRRNELMSRLRAHIVLNEEARARRAQRRDWHAQHALP